MQQVDVFYSSTRRYQKSPDKNKQSKSAGDLSSADQPPDLKSKIGVIDNQPQKPAADDQPLIISDDHLIEKTQALLQQKETQMKEPVFQLDADPLKAEI